MRTSQISKNYFKRYHSTDSISSRSLDLKLAVISDGPMYDMSQLFGLVQTNKKKFFSSGHQFVKKISADNLIPF
jgi:hypothetical protein